MSPALNLGLIFPIKDEPSAWLMSLKAECLYEAGILNKAEKQELDARVRRARAIAKPKQAA